jgi:putative toxin-antitoxin system antitoxin component (TIGR02293 family)
MSTEEMVAEATGRETVINRAIEVIGDEDEAHRWFGIPMRALDYRTPVSLLGSHEGRAAVLAVLTRLEHGVL